MTASGPPIAIGGLAETPCRAGQDWLSSIIHAAMVAERVEITPARVGPADPRWAGEHKYSPAGTGGGLRHAETAVLPSAAGGGRDRPGVLPGLVQHLEI